MHFAVVGTNLRAGKPLEVRGKGIRGGGRGAADSKHVPTVRTINTVCQQQYFDTRCPSLFVGNFFCLHSMCLFSLY
jgi:hypothetical protein